VIATEESSVEHAALEPAMEEQKAGQA